jgi:hypothetical protein
MMALKLEASTSALFAVWLLLGKFHMSKMIKSYLVYTAGFKEQQGAVDYAISGQ